MKKLVFLLNFILISGCACYAQNTITHSAITFKIKNLGIDVGGTIGGLQANINFNPANLAAASIEASVDVKTLNTDNSLRDEHIKSDEFFDPARYPKILLKSVSIVHKSGNKYTGRFNLTIKNKTKAVEIPFVYTSKGPETTFNGTFKINRLDFGLGDSSLTLSNEVVISIDASFRD